MATLIGLVSGIVSGMFGVGGGVVMVPAMLYFLTPPIRDIKQAIGTSLAVIIPTAIMGVLKHHDADPARSNVMWKVALALAPTAILGSYIGAWLAREHLDVAVLKRCFGALLVIVGAQIALTR